LFHPSGVRYRERLTRDEDPDNPEQYFHVGEIEVIEDDRDRDDRSRRPSAGTSRFNLVSSASLRFL